MNYALYATGPDGQFGLNGKLPWGSLPEELEHFYVRAEKAIAVVVGAKTYFNSPKRLRDFLNTKIVYVYGSVDGKLRSDKHFFLTKLTSSFRKVTKDYSVVFIGGKALLEKAMKEKLLDVLVATEIRPNCPTQAMPADVYLAPFLVDIPESASVVYTKQGRTEEFNFKVRSVYL